MQITKVVGARVLIKVIVEEKIETDSGLAIAPASINPSYFKGEVVGLGEKLTMDVLVGDKVCFVKYGYEDMGDDQYIVEENGILCVYE